MLENIESQKRTDRPSSGLDRLPPQNIEAEQSVLGAILLEHISKLRTEVRDIENHGH